MFIIEVELTKEGDTNTFLLQKFLFINSEISCMNQYLMKNGH